jgi:hypothetical protein
LRHAPVQRLQCSPDAPCILRRTQHTCAHKAQIAVAWRRLGCKAADRRAIDIEFYAFGHFGRMFLSQTGSDAVVASRRSCVEGRDARLMLFVCHLKLQWNGRRQDRLISPSNARTQSAPLSFSASRARAGASALRTIGVSHQVKVLPQTACGRGKTFRRE